MILVVAMQSYAVNCSMTEALHPNMPAACYVPGAPAASARAHAKQEEEDEIEEEDAEEEDGGEAPRATPQEEADKELDW